MFKTFSTSNIYGQTKALWTEADRKYLITNLERTKHELIKETQNLTPKQWSFKKDATNWSRVQVVDHLGVYEKLLYRVMLSNQYTNERPDLVDSLRGIDTIMLANTGDPNKGIAPYFIKFTGRSKHKQDLVSFFNRFSMTENEIVQMTPANFHLRFVFRPPRLRYLAYS